MATHSSILAWSIPLSRILACPESWTEEPSGLQFMGSHGPHLILITSAKAPSPNTVTVDYRLPQ